MDVLTVIILATLELVCLKVFGLKGTITINIVFVIGYVIAKLGLI